ncbi:TPA: hypothetical protein ACGO1T_001028 [Streptococcus suis]
MLKSVKVGGIEYEIVLKDLSTRYDDENGKTLGFCLVPENTIEIDDTIAKDRQNQTFVHELMHAIFLESGTEDDEALVNRLALVLYQVLQDNDFSFLRK